MVETENEGVDGTGATHGRDPQSVPSFKPGQPMAMPERQMLCIVEPVKTPFMSKAPAYWDTQFNQDLDPSPYHQG